MTLVDTDVLIAHLRGTSAAHAWLKARRRESPLSVSVVSVAELTGGMRSGERREVWGLIADLRVEPITELIARRAGEFKRIYKRSHSGIDIGDYLIAATASELGLPLATLNVKHFPMFAELEAPFEV